MKYIALFLLATTVIGLAGCKNTYRLEENRGNNQSVQIH